MLVKDRIAFERKKQGISATQLAESIGINQGTISRYETGNIKVIPIDVLRKIAVALGCDFDELVKDDPKYCSFASKQEGNVIISEDDRSLLTWFHNLPEDLKKVVRQLWNIPIAVK